MAFPTIPTVAAGRVLTALQANTTAIRTFPNLSSLTKNAGDLLIAIIIGYQSSVSNSAYSSWGGGFTEFHDFGTSTSLATGMAYKWSDGTEAGTFSVTQADAITGHAAMILLSIPGAHPSTPPATGGTSQTTNATVPNLPPTDPGNWDVEDTLWIAIAGDGETSTTGSYTAITAGPTNYTNFVATGISGDVVGGVQAAVAFRQLAAASEDYDQFTFDTSNARHVAMMVAVRPTPPPRWDFNRHYRPSRGNIINASWY